WAARRAYNPKLRQARRNAGRLGRFLQADKIKQWVEPVVVWANPDGRLSVENPTVAVWTLDRLAEELGNLYQDRKVDESTQARIAEKLTRLGEKGRE
ncbi:MAG: NERD domain-containing protein, partial [Chloroflexia bacterium]|nr:NERD domain-containing protein [Chloroflexia bacterium]